MKYLAFLCLLGISLNSRAQSFFESTSNLSLEYTHYFPAKNMKQVVTGGNGLELRYGRLSDDLPLNFIIDLGFAKFNQIEEPIPTWRFSVREGMSTDSDSTLYPGVTAFTFGLGYRFYFTESQIAPFTELGYSFHRLSAEGGGILPWNNPPFAVNHAVYLGIGVCYEVFDYTQIGLSFSRSFNVSTSFPLDSYKIGLEVNYSLY
ncbi:hypothetical protein GYB22_01305 [bacterium]|nr:hypothetical protein [bacterium]